MTCHLGQMLCFTTGYMLICVICVSAVDAVYNYGRPPLSLKVYTYYTL